MTRRPHRSDSSSTGCVLFFFVLSCVYSECSESSLLCLCSRVDLFAPRSLEPPAVAVLVRAAEGVEARLRELPADLFVRLEVPDAPARSASSVLGCASGYTGLSEEDPDSPGAALPLRVLDDLRALTLVQVRTLRLEVVQGVEPDSQGFGPLSAGALDGRPDAEARLSVQFPEGAGGARGSVDGVTAERRGCRAHLDGLDVDACLGPMPRRIGRPMVPRGAPK